MNYRHEYHAGNFADVLKHIILARILLHLTVKPAAFRYVETHAGSGIYSLAGIEAAKTAEWRDGIGRLATARLSPEAQELIEPYLTVVRPFLEGDAPRYPGSPALAQALLRPQDRMLFCELQPAVRARLVANLGKDLRARSVVIDGYAGLNAFIPPVERRGVVLIDPPFEVADEFTRLAGAIQAAWHKWATGIYVIWYPVKDPHDVAAFARSIVKSDIRRVLRIELEVEGPRRDGPLKRSGLMIINPPYRIEAEALHILRFLASCLSRGRGDFLVESLVGE